MGYIAKAFRNKFISYVYFSQKLSKNLSVSKTLKVAIDVATNILDAEVGSILLLDTSNNILKIAAHKGLPKDVASKTRISVGKYISGYVFKTKRPLLIKNVERYPYLHPVGSERYYTKSLISCPLNIKDKTIGVININNKKTREVFNKFDLDLLKGICSQISITLDNARQFEELQSTYRETLESLILAIDARDHYTKIHSEKVASLGEKLALYLKLPRKNVEVLREACYLHDIGKIGIPDNILNKPSRLTLEEFDIMKQHALIGFNILKPLKFFGEIPWIVRANHERWDGKGYPDGLKGKKIPLGARILCICDAYATMRDERPYKKAFTHNQAIREIKMGKGKQFDPYIAQGFMKLHL